MRDRACFVAIVEVLENHHELVAAQASDRVALAQRMLKARADGSQQTIASLVTECVVDFLESVEIEEDERERGFFRRARAIACKRRSWKSVRLGRPVMESNCAT